MKIEKITLNIKFNDGNRICDYDYVFVLPEKISELLSKDMGIVGEILREICGAEA